MENITLAADLTRLPMNQTLQLFPGVDATDSTIEPFQGSIMQFSLFDQALTSEQVKDLFEEGIGEAAVVPLYLEARASDAIVIEQDVPISLHSSGSEEQTRQLQYFPCLLIFKAIQRRENFSPLEERSRRG